MSSLPPSRRGRSCSATTIQNLCGTQSALRQSGRPGSIDNVLGVGRRNIDVHRIVGGIEELLEPYSGYLEAGRLPFLEPSQDDYLPELRQALLYEREPVEKVMGDHENLRIGLIDDVSQELALVGRVDGNLDCAHLRRTPPDMEVLRTVGEHDADFVTLGDALVQKGICASVCGAVHLFVSEGLILETQEDPLPVSLRPILYELSQDIRYLFHWKPPPPSLLKTVNRYFSVPSACPAGLNFGSVTSVEPPYLTLFSLPP